MHTQTHTEKGIHLGKKEGFLSSQLAKGVAKDFHLSIFSA